MVNDGGNAREGYMTDRHRKQIQRERDRENGIKEITVRVHHYDVSAVKSYAQFLLKKRIKQ